MSDRSFGGSFSGRAERLSDLYCMSVRIVKTEDFLPPGLPLERVDKLHVRRDILKSRVDIRMLELKEKISSAIGFFRARRCPPDGLGKRPPVVDCKASFKADEVSEILGYLQAEPVAIKRLRPIDVTHERDGIYKTHRFPP